MPNYQNTKIYIIRSRNTNKVYVGATASTLVKRFSQHNSEFAKGKNKTRARQVLEHGDCYIELLEKYPCLDKDESNAREKYWMRQFDEQRVNCQLPGRTKAEWYQDNREVELEKNKRYRQNNKQKCNEQSRQWYENNKQKCNEQSRQWYENNKQRFNKQRNQRFECLCGSQCTHANRARHMKTIKHRTWVFNQWNELNHL